MDVTPQARQRLADRMEERRLDLGLTWREVAARGGLTYEAIRALRAGDHGTPQPLTLRKVDRGLEWKPGSAQRVLYDSAEPDDILTPEERAAVTAYPQAVAQGVQSRQRNGRAG